MSEYKFGGYKGFFNSYKKLLEHRQNTKGRLSYQDNADKIIKVKIKNKETGITISHDMRLAIVKPTNAYMPQRQDIHIFQNMENIEYLSSYLNRYNGIVALDLETCGTQAADINNFIVGIGLADASNIAYFDLTTSTKECVDYLYDWINNYKDGFVGHNVFFDGTFLMRDTKLWANWKYDTYAMYMQLANEGYPGHSYGLKNAQIDLLNWDAKGDIELDEWLVNNGYISDIKKDKKEGYVYTEDYEGKGERWLKPKKDMMYRAPARILGFYCGLDVAATYQLLNEVFLPSIKDEPFETEFIQYHNLFMENVYLHGIQQLTGITIDPKMLESHNNYLTENIKNHYGDFVNHPKVRPFADERNEDILKELKEKEPVKFKKVKWPKEPKQFKQDGSQSKAWENWKKKTEELMERGPEITSHWTTWKAKLDKAKTMEHLNLNSSQQMQWLFYEKMGCEVLVRTDSGQPATGATALPGFGEVGELLATQKAEEKELGYVKTCIEKLIGNRLHPQFRMPGTLSGRLAGSGGISVHQIPKSRKYLECWYPMENGKVWIDCDHTALEQVVLAELSKDSALYNLYSKEAKPNDVYIYNGALMARDFNVKLFQPFLDEGYIPERPDPEVIKRIKKKHKNLRGISKTASLGKTYGMGWKKFQMNMKLAGIKMNEAECRMVIEGLDKIYSGVKKYEHFLLKEHADNNGWVLNGIGRPVCVGKDYLKDIVNRVIQSTGHDIHMLYIKICQDLFKENNLDVNGIILDFHDQSIVECNEKDKELVHYLIGTKAYEILNQEYLKGQIELKGDPQYITTMADAKCE